MKTLDDIVMGFWALAVCFVLITGRIIILTPVAVFAVLFAMLLLGSYFAFAIIGGIAESLWRGLLKAVK